MRLRWNTTLGLVVLVAGSAVVTAVAAAMSTAFYGGRDNPLLGLGLVVASIGAMCWVRTARELALRRAGGESLSRWAKARLLVASLSFALLTIGLSGLAFVVVFGALTEVRWDFPRVKFDGGVNLQLVMIAVIAGSLAALLVGFLVRRAYGADVSRKRRLARLLATVALVVFLVWGEAMRRTVVYRLGRLAKHHDRLAELAKHDHRWYLSDDGSMVDLGTPGSYPRELEKHYAALRSKWEYLVWHPWIGADADPPEPKRSNRPSAK